MITPARAARDNPETIATGAARISGHGVATTSTATARTGSPLTAQAAPAITRLTSRNQPANRSAMPDEGRTARLSLLHEPDDAGVGALRRRRCSPAGRTPPRR